MRRGKISIISTVLFVLFFCGDCSKKNTDPVPPPTPPVSVNEVDFWLTKADQSVLLEKQTGVLSFGTSSNSYNTIEVDSAQVHQSIDGFGYTLTGGSAYLINRMGNTQSAALLTEIFGNGNNSIGVSYLRVSIGASDLNESVFSYDDMPAGQTDPTLTNFSLSQDTVDVIPVLKRILAINPNIKIMGSPWSAPVWMKDNGSSIGGSLQPQYYSVYAQYFVKYIQQMKAKGITIDAITVQNEPQHGGNNPSMVMSAAQQAELVKNHLGPAFQSAGITTKIIIWDHNCDNPNYPITVLNDATARQYIDGSAFHLYAGDISALSSVKAVFPDKNLYFTEQWTGANGTFNGDLKWHTKNVIIGSMRNWSRNALEWNLASNPFYQPHTAGGCSECKGAVTIDNSSYIRNVSYYIIAHASKFVPAGSVRIASTITLTLPNVAFVTPAGKKVLIILNDGTGPESFNIKFKTKWTVAALAAGSVGTFIW
ncbi:MAG: glucosylceramidase [Chitinophagaceae bacterium]|nr:glucosylceramidase [Chitinophagaceae bacterium]